MNLSLTNLRVHPFTPTWEESEPALTAGHLRGLEDSAQIRRLRSLLSLLALYATALFVVILFSDGADIGCILAGIAGHVLYASGKTALAWREASWLENTRSRLFHRRVARA